MRLPNFISLFLIFAVMTVSSCSANMPGTDSPSGNGAVTNSSPETGAAEGAGALADVDKAIRKIDFKNFTYEPFCAGATPEKVTIKDGEFSKETKDKDSDFVDRFYFGVTDVVYGDIDNDNKEDAVVLTNCNTGGTGQFSEGFVYILKSGKPVMAERIAGGDRAYGGLRTAKIVGGVVEIERNDVGEAGGACCPEFSITTKYKWNGKKLVKSGADPRREIYPAEKVSFAKGSSKAAMKITVDDVKRYSFGARAGQSISVSVDSPDVSVSLIKGDADVTEGTNGFSGRLKESGEYTIQLQNNGEKATEVTVTIEIK